MFWSDSLSFDWVALVFRNLPGALSVPAVTRWRPPFRLCPPFAFFVTGLTWPGLLRLPQAPPTTTTSWCSFNSSIPAACGTSIPVMLLSYREIGCPRIPTGYSSSWPPFPVHPQPRQFFDVPKVISAPSERAIHFLIPPSFLREIRPSLQWTQQSRFDTLLFRILYEVS